MRTFFKRTGTAFLLLTAICLGLIFAQTYNTYNRTTAFADEVDSVRYFDDYYSAADGGVFVYEPIQYSYKTESGILINNNFPEYCNNDPNITNSCANSAGSIIIGAYDRYYDELIPSFTAGLIRNGKYTYYPMAMNLQAVQGVINSLYQYMGTNNPNAGTTQNQYKNGLNTYVNGKNRNITFASVMTNGAIDFTKAYNAFAAGKPVSLFMSGYNICEITTITGGWALNKNFYSGNHIMIAYGYKVVSYYNSNDVVFRTDTFLVVSSALSYPRMGYFLLGEGVSTMNDAESAYIY